MKVYKNREEVPDKYKWDLKEYFKNDLEFNNTFKEAEEKIKELLKYPGCTKSANKLLKFLKLDEETSILVENLYVYAYLVNDQELGNSKSMSNKSKTEILMSEYINNISFFNPELLKLSKDEYNNLFKNVSLLEYKPLLDRIYRNTDHILNEKEESIINRLISASDHYDDISSNMLNNAHNYGKVLLDNKEVDLTPTNYHKIMKNDDRSFRKNTYEQFNSVLNQYGSISSSLLDSFVKLTWNNLKIHNYKSSFDAKLFEDNMPKKVYDTLIKNVLNNTKYYQKYLKLLKKEYNYDKLYPYDLSLNLIKNEKEYSIEDAKDLLLKSISILGDDYYSKFKKIFDNHYIDFCTYKGKCSGGYSFGTSTNNSRILMSYNGDLSSVSTIAHEGGHNVHHQYVKENNQVSYRNVPSLVCEVASLTNECLLSNFLAKNGEDKNEKLSGIANILEVINSNLFGAVREGLMEQDFYKLVENNGTITKDYMDNLTLEYLNKFYGSEVELKEYANISWARRSHYYMFFYLFSYSICISVALYVASEIIKGNKKMLDNYLKFLSTGSDKWPIEAFKILGIDLTKDEVYIGALNYYNNLIDEYLKIRNEES